MKILLSPAKDMKAQPLSGIMESTRTNAAESANVSTAESPKASTPHRVTAHEKRIKTCLSSFSEDELATLFHLGGKTLFRTYSYFHEAYQSCSAGELYSGLAYKALGYPTLADEAKQYLAHHLLILSALYGPLSPQTAIHPYRLDFTISLHNRGIDLVASWRKQWGQCLEQEDLILNTASLEFSSLFNKDDYGRRWIDFSFYEEDVQTGTKKQHATISKKGRGALVRAMALAGINRLTDIKRLTFDGFSFRPADSSAQHMVFVRPLALQ